MRDKKLYQKQTAFVVILGIIILAIAWLLVNWDYNLCINTCGGGGSVECPNPCPVVPACPVIPPCPACPDCILPGDLSVATQRVQKYRLASHSVDDKTDAEYVAKVDIVTPTTWKMSVVVENQTSANSFLTHMGLLDIVQPALNEFINAQQADEYKNYWLFHIQANPTCGARLGGYIDTLTYRDLGGGVLATPPLNAPSILEFNMVASLPPSFPGLPVGFFGGSCASLVDEFTNTIGEDEVTNFIRSVSNFIYQLEDVQEII